MSNLDTLISVINSHCGHRNGRWALKINPYEITIYMKFPRSSSALLDFMTQLEKIRPVGVIFFLAPLRWWHRIFRQVRK